MLRLRGSCHHALPVQEYSARYCTDYLGDIGLAVDPNPMDFSAWAEVFLDGRWYIIDARHNNPRIGRIVMGRGRDARGRHDPDPFGIAKLARFEVITQLQTKPKTADDARIAK
jgi:transglutaminase-like putative cysteine protease